MDLLKVQILLELFQDYSNSIQTYFKIEQQIFDKSLSNFPKWPRNRENYGTFLIRKIETFKAYWFLFIRWNENKGIYLIIYPEKRTGPLIEIHKLENENLHWIYNPAKRDGRNPERVLYFEKYFYSSQVQISIPEGVNEVEDFYQEIFQLVENRLKADFLDPETPEYRMSFPEGKRSERKHYARERNSKLIQFVKNKFLKENGRLFCQICNFDFQQKYGPRGIDFIEAHHTRPISDLDIDGSETKEEEIILVCSNCHRIIHRVRPWLKIDEIKKILK